MSHRYTRLLWSLAALWVLSAGTIWAQTPVLEVENSSDVTVFSVNEDGSLTAPIGAAAGYVLTTDKSGNATWQAAPSGGGLVLPFSGASSTTPAFEIENTATSGAARAIVGTTASPVGQAISGLHEATSGGGVGVQGISSSSEGIGVFGLAAATSGTTYGVRGENQSTGGYGVYGRASSTTGVNYGVYGESASPDGFAGYFDGAAQVTGALQVGSFILPAGASEGYVLTSDASGNATWATSSITLPFTGSASTSLLNPALGVTQTSAGSAVAGITTGLGVAGRFEVDNGSNASAALFAETNGDGQAGFFQVNNSSSTGDALFVTTNGAGNAVMARNVGAGNAGVFEIQNTSSDASALRVVSDGDGAALEVEGNGAGYALSVTDGAASFSGDGVIIATATSINAEAYLNGSLTRITGLTRMYGDVESSIPASGLVKAGVAARCPGDGSSTAAKVFRSFENIAGSDPVITIEKLTTTPDDLGGCIIDFGFDITGRFWQATPTSTAYTPSNGGQWFVDSVTCGRPTGVVTLSNSELVCFGGSGLGAQDVDIMVLIY